MKEYNFKINGNDYAVSIDNIDDATAEVTVNGVPYSVELSKEAKPKQTKFTQVAPDPGAVPAARPNVAKPTEEITPVTPLKSPLPGVIIDIKVKEGDTVSEGQNVIILEAMKMENNVNAHRSGIVRSINVSRGDSVLEGDSLITIG